MKITHKSLMITFEHNVTLGDITATLVAQAWVDSANPKSDTFDLDFIDIINIKYKGIEIEGYDNWRKFKKVHMDIGIDLDKLLDNEFEKAFNKEIICEMIAAQNYKF